MAGFANVQAMVNAELNGQSTFFTFRKAPTQTNAINTWFDLSMSPGNPIPQYYASTPLASVALTQSNDGGLFHGAAVTPSKKYLRKICINPITNTLAPMVFRVLDYLMYYPFIDEGTVDPQPLTNNVTLPRYTDGKGVKIMAVSVAARTGGQTFNCSYTNQDGVSGRTTVTAIQSSAGTTNGCVITSDRAVAGTCGPFLTLQSGDTGVRSIESVQMVSGTDVGLFALVLVKPLFEFQIMEVQSPTEVDLLKDFSNCPQIQDNAYLNMIMNPIVSGTVSGAINGYIQTVWN